MKLFNSKFKSLGYEQDLENSYIGYDEYVKNEDGNIKRISISYFPNDELIIIHEIYRDDEGEWQNHTCTEISSEEIDAINTFRQAKGMGSAVKFIKSKSIYESVEVIDEDN